MSKKRGKSTLFRISRKYTLASTLSNPLKIDMKMPIKAVKGMAMVNIFKGVDNCRVWNIFTEMRSEVKKRSKERRTLTITTIYKAERTTSLTFDVASFPL